MSYTVGATLSFDTPPGRVRPDIMMLYALLAYTSALLSSGLVIFVLCARRRTIVHWSFAAGMSTIALMETFMGLRVQAVQLLSSLLEIFELPGCRFPTWELVAD
jgi:hypothetical protein